MCRASAVIVWSLLIPTIISASEPERLLNVRDMYPSISPDGRLLVFESNRSGTSQVYARILGDEEGDASTIKLTNSEFGAETPVISPDGTQIVLAIYVAEGNNDVFVMNIDGSDLRQLTFGPGYDGHPPTANCSDRSHTQPKRQSSEISKSGENAIGMTYLLMTCV